MDPQPPSARRAHEHVGGHRLRAAEASGPVVSSPVRMFSVQVTEATPSSRRLTSTSVRKNWMYGVFAITSAHER